jgi:RimJ/RimL family protein N-acetyltransferase
MLRPLRPEDVELATRWMTDPLAGGEFQWAGFRSPESFRQRVVNGELITDDGGGLAIVDETIGEVVGDVSWRSLRTGPAPTSSCWSIGIIVVAEHRGKGHGSAAQRQLADYLFAHTTVERVQADTDVANVGEQRALLKAGFTREGVMRKIHWRAGQWRDMVLFSKLRGEP